MAASIFAGSHLRTVHLACTSVARLCFCCCSCTNWSVTLCFCRRTLERIDKGLIAACIEFAIKSISGKTNNREDHKARETRGTTGRRVSFSRTAAWLIPTFRNPLDTRSKGFAFSVLFNMQLLENNIPDYRTAAPVLQSRNMQKNIMAPIVGLNKAKAFFIIPTHQLSFVESVIHRFLFRQIRVYRQIPSLFC